MPADLTDLAREIAATGDRWLIPGVGVVDRVTGARFRYVPTERDDDDSTEWPIEGQCEMDWPESDNCWDDLRRRALAAGPDLSDAATALTLLSLVPEHDLLSTELMPGQVRWACATRHGQRIWHSTRTEAIARAVLSALKEG